MNNNFGNLESLLASLPCRAQHLPNPNLACEWSLHSIWPERQQNGGVTGPKPQDDPRDGRNLGISHTVNISPPSLLFLYVKCSFSPPPPPFFLL